MCKVRTDKGLSLDLVWVKWESPGGGRGLLDFLFKDSRLGWVIMPFFFWRKRFGIKSLTERGQVFCLTTSEPRDARLKEAGTSG